MFDYDIIKKVRELRKIAKHAGLSLRVPNYEQGFCISRKNAKKDEYFVFGNVEKLEAFIEGYCYANKIDISKYR